jgi:hypothetical protein
MLNRTLSARRHWVFRTRNNRFASAGRSFPGNQTARIAFRRRWGVGVACVSNAYRERAAECFRLARRVNDPRQRALLLEMARAWLRLHDQAEKNARADVTYETPPPRQRIPQVPQQQQQRLEPEE